MHLERRLQRGSRFSAAQEVSNSDMISHQSRRFFGLTILASIGASNLITPATETTMAGMTLIVIRASFHCTASATT